MTIKDFQAWLNARGASIPVDGKAGPATRSAIDLVFSNKKAPAVTSRSISQIALRLGCTTKQLRAVAFVESGGSAYDDDGRPKMLFERHLFHRLTNGARSVSAWSDPEAGGYGESSWDKLGRAASTDPEDAFAACSWGKFQILGLHWKLLGYANPIELAYSNVRSEAGHYELLARFIEKTGLKQKLKMISADPETCRPFAAAYNGPGYRKFRYDEKLAARMA